MIEDKLNRDERIRLEALNQAVAMNAMGNNGPSAIVRDAKELETYIRAGSSRET
jgi:hypothetical protein